MGQPHGEALGKSTMLLWALVVAVIGGVRKPLTAYQGLT